MESCIFCLRNAFQGMVLSQQTRKQELHSIITLYKQILSSQQIELNISIFSEILQLCLSVIENNELSIVKT